MSEAEKRKAAVSHDLCVGVGMCVLTAPKAFRLNAEGLSEPTGEDDEALQAAADACPMSAITLLD
ncbi:MAG: ferredoxin [Hyphomonadaceae bacterium]